MIKSFKNKALRRFFETGQTRGLSVQNPKRLRAILQALDVAKDATEMNLPGFRCHPTPSQANDWAVDASGNWRVTYSFKEGHAVDVDLEDYH